MSTRIEVPGRFTFSGGGAAFIFENGQELDLSSLLSYEPARKALATIMGVGINSLDEMIRPTAPEPDVATLTMEDAERQAGEALQQAANFLRESEASLGG